MTDSYRQSLLIQHLRSPLPPLMELEESPPPVPPKDFGYKLTMGDGSSRPASGSKRKRESHDDNTYSQRNGRLDDFTPTKRARSNAGTSNGETSNDEAAIQRSVRRKKGTRNLSRLNLRHAASMSNVQDRQSSPIRESKFQEGSLTDKPSEKPPSVYTRFIRTDSGNLQHVDQLMTDYHEGIATPANSVEATVRREAAIMPQMVAEIDAQQKKEGGMFRFGKSIAAAFHPVSIWHRLWNEQNNITDSTTQDIANSNRILPPKEEVEARYAEMKSSGQFNLKPVSVHTPHDSAIALNVPTSGRAHTRVSSIGSAQHVPHDDASREGSELPESASKPQLRGKRSRLHLRKPSLQNLKNGITSGLKRVASDMNLAGAAAADRESSSSISPVKPEFGSALKYSHSKQDLKRQRRLSKRVSDLESKLQKARGELDDALVAASPMPNLPRKHERFTPSSTIRRPKFIPGALATLPSEGVLFPERTGQIGGGQEATKNLYPRPRKALDLSQAFDDIESDEEEEDEGTIKAPRGRPYPVNAKNLFSDQENYRQSQPQDTVAVVDTTMLEPNPTSKLTEFTEVAILDGSRIANDDVKMEAMSPLESSDFEDAQESAQTKKTVKSSKKGKKSKRRSLPRSDDPHFTKPDDEDDDAEWEEAELVGKKLRKPVNQGEVTRKGKRLSAPSDSPAGKIPRKAIGQGSSPKQAKESPLQTLESSPAFVDDEGQSEDELAKISAHGSMVSVSESLEPVYEEEEETTTVPLKDVPSKPTAKATPARFGRNAVRGRSTSPHKRGRVEIVVEETMMTRATEAAVTRRGSRSISPLPKEIEVVTVMPGENDVPLLPGATDSKIGSPRKAKTTMAKENFEWPDDVF